ncbi:MAG: transglycosylase SLT domain-containing protein [Bacteroidales bacterium]
MKQILLSLFIFSFSVCFAQNQTKTLTVKQYSTTDTMHNSIKDSVIIINNPNLYHPKKQKSNILNKVTGLFKTGPSKKELKNQNDYLKYIIDSLQNEIIELNTPIELIDTEEDNEINPGMLEEIDDFRADSLARMDTVFNPDSLLSLWYLQEEIDMTNPQLALNDTIELTSNIPDSVYLEKLKKMNSFISIPYNKIIRNHIIYYTEKLSKNNVENLLGLAQYYMPIFDEIFSDYDMPVELKAMAVIESALRSKAVSRARAKGMWQFMYSTGKRYNLLINSYVDERYDPIKSAHAAAKYLQDSYQIFGDWSLAIASYNCGAGNVNKAIRRSGKKDFWGIYWYLPRETRGYVPSFIAALYLMNYYQDYGFVPTDMKMPVHTDTLQVNKMLHFKQIEHFTGISENELKNLNPQYLHNIIPGTEKTYTLRLPYNYTMNFVNNEKDIYNWEKDKYFNPTVLKQIKQTGSSQGTRIVHRVRRGETLSGLASKYHVRISDIKHWNRIGKYLRQGQRLILYPHSHYQASSSSSKTYTSKGYIWYTVKRGDTVSGIATKFRGATINSIFKLNHLNKHSKIYPGKRLKIKKK